MEADRDLVEGGQRRATRDGKTHRPLPKPFPKMAERLNGGDSDTPERKRVRPRV